MNKRFILYVAAAMAIAACKNGSQEILPEKEVIEEQISQETIAAPDVTATQEANPATKSTLEVDSEGIGTIYWTPADEINVFYGTTSTHYVSRNTENATTTVFRTTDVIGTNEGASENIWGLYPYNEQATCTGSTITTSLPATQYGVPGTFDDELFITIAHNTSTALSFYNVCGGIKFSLSRDDITSITFCGNNNEDLAGDFSISLVDGLPSVDVTSGVKTITLTPKTGDTFASGVYYYLIMRPVVLSEGFTMTFETETETGTFNYTAKSVEIKRSIFGKKDNIDSYATFSSSTVAPEAVDLGLSVHWATCNVGAILPEDYGDYFAWGETSPRAVVPEGAYAWAIYQWCNGRFYQLLKYNTNPSYGDVDGLTVLEMSDDAARVNLGGNWRMPTANEQDELLQLCTWTWTAKNGIYGYEVVSSINGNKIFLPAAGYKGDDNNISYANLDGLYWSSSLTKRSEVHTSIRLRFSETDIDHIDINRSFGLSVRPVIPNEEYIHLTNIAITPDDITLDVGGSQALLATVSPSNATNCTVTWSSSDSNVASVSNTGVVTANGEGTATITATTMDGGLTATCGVTVNPVIPEASINLSAAGTANCYIVPSAGTYSFLAVKGNSTEPIGEVKGVKVLWETFGTTDVPEVGSIIAPTVRYSQSDNTIYFDTNDSYTQGSALIAAFSDEACSDGNVLWSWHIWCTSDDLAGNLVNLRNNAGTIMDRNLGATTGTRSEYSCFSLLYQYGRKDPFLGGCHISSNNMQQAASTGVWNTSAATGYENSVMYPTTFFSSWAEGDEDNISWSEQKNIYDPCPPGYRVPDTYVYSAAAQYYFGESSFWSIGTRGTTIGWYNGANYTDYQSVWFPNTNALFSASSLMCHGKYGWVTRDGAVWTCGGAFYSAMYDGIVHTVSGWQLIPKKTGNAVRCVTESSPIVVNTESVSVNMNSVVIEPFSSFDINATVYPANANVNAIYWNDLSDRFTMTNNTDGSVRFTDNKGYIGKYYVGAYSPLALYGSNDEWIIRWDGSLADKCEVTVCPSEPAVYRYGGWYLQAKSGDVISFHLYVGDSDDGDNEYSITLGNTILQSHSGLSGYDFDFSYTFTEAFSGWLYIQVGWGCDVSRISTTATVLGKGYTPLGWGTVFYEDWISQPSYKFEYNNHVLTIN